MGGLFYIALDRDLACAAALVDYPPLKNKSRADRIAAKEGCG